MKKHLIIVADLCLMLNSCNQNAQKSSQSMQSSQNSQWRGKNRDGVYNETGLLKVWPENGPELLWSYEGLGAGFTSAAVTNEKLYITGLFASVYQRPIHIHNSNVHSRIYYRSEC